MKGTMQILVRDPCNNRVVSRSFQCLENVEVDYLVLDEDHNSLEWSHGQVVKTGSHSSFLELTVKDLGRHREFKLICSPEHEFMMSDRTYKTAGQIDTHDVFLTNECTSDGGFAVKPSRCEVRSVNWIIYNAYPQNAYTIQSDAAHQNCVIYSNKELFICKLNNK